MDEFNTYEDADTVGERAGKSLGKAATALGLFVLSFGLLWWNEGRAVQTERSLTEGQGAVVSVSADNVDNANENRLIHISGATTVDAPIVDPDLNISLNGLRMKRVVETYQWEEEKETKNVKVGGKKKKKTTYTYKKGWHEGIIDSSEFNQSDLYPNPVEAPLESMTFSSTTAKLGAFPLADNVLSKTGSFESANVDKFNADALNEDYQVDAKGDLFFSRRRYIGNKEVTIGRGTREKPEVGDVRVSYQVVPVGEYSVIAQQNAGGLQSYQTKAGDAILLVDAGIVPADKMFAAAQAANETMTWILRLVGFLMMMFGFRGIFAPFSEFLRNIPVVGAIVEFGITLAALLVALPLSLITVSIAWIFFRPVLGIGLLVTGVAVMVGAFFLAKKRKGASQMVTNPA